MKTRIVYLCFAAILVAAIASITVGSLGYVWLDEIGEVLRDDSFAYSFSITLITIGVASFFFCIVFFREPSLRLSFVGLVIVAILLTAVGVLTLVYTESFVTEALDTFFRNFLIPNTINNVQQNLECCGTTGPHIPPGTMPNSCCPLMNCVGFAPFSRGCNLALREHVNMVFDIVGWTSVGLAIFLALTGLILVVVYKVSGSKSET